jgi:HAD superfamily hydrolase (TIGR01450 family)
LLKIDNFDAFCFDLDGTIFLGNERLPGAKEVVEQIRTAGKKILFITNSPTQTREDCRVRLEKLSIEADKEEILTAPHVAASYFQERIENPSIYIVGEEALNREFEPFSLNVTTNPLHATHLLVGLDRRFTYDTLHEAMKAVRNGAQMIITNPDPVCPVPGGFIPDTYSLAKAIEVASGDTATDIIGKPSAYYAEKIEEKLNVPKNRVLIIGDRLDTDIMLGQKNDFPTCLVLTGATDRNQVEASHIQPDYIVETLLSFGEVVLNR